MTPITTVGELRRILASLDDGTVLFFKATMGQSSGAVYPVEAVELIPGDVPVLELSGPRSRALAR